ncbi:divalent metal cation transporter MntH [Aliidongia dinghuensis]|uniref:Divalent metal cation transporter MntH n=1 Tax=Aliidongia dinghuensis TaxID=1867774 RepID=A0A8J2YRH7_9PROT|nr:Nramp family divalent metal transporter [Aliidongia dinghuensis]GGF09620.1 divalent metal cation transporter MntH [Aliidongia dinghuensis]
MAPSDVSLAEPMTPGLAPRSVSLGPVHRSIRIPVDAGWFRKLLAFGGPGYLVSVGYMDPGNWATDLAGGSAYGYTLLSVVVLSSLMAMLLQALSLRLGIATGRDLAQLSRERFGPRASFAFWAVAELAIVACDLAEVIGTAIALELLFGLPLLWGVLLTAGDTLLVLGLQRWGFRGVEALVVGLIALITVCFGYELLVSSPAMAGVLGGLVPRTQIVHDPAMLYVAIGIIGATVMPHNLYLHSALVQTRGYAEDEHGKREAIRFATIDSNVALGFALLINAAILVLAAATFHTSGHQDIAELQDAYHLIAPLLGAPLAATVFALALLCAGQNSTLTGTLAGQIVMEGFLHMRIRPWLRRLVTRALAVVPAAIVVALSGEQATGDMLIGSQVVLSLQLPFAMIPLVWLTGDKRLMGPFANSRMMSIAAWTVSLLIVALNLKLAADMLF